MQKGLYETHGNYFRSSFVVVFFYLQFFLCCWLEGKIFYAYERDHKTPLQKRETENYIYFYGFSSYSHVNDKVFAFTNIFIHFLYTFNFEIDKNLRRVDFLINFIFNYTKNVCGILLVSVGVDVAYIWNAFCYRGEKFERTSEAEADAHSL